MEAFRTNAKAGRSTQEQVSLVPFRNFPKIPKSDRVGHDTWIVASLRECAGMVSGTILRNQTLFSTRVYVHKSASSPPNRGRCV